MKLVDYVDFPHERGYEGAQLPILVLVVVIGIVFLFAELFFLAALVCILAILLASKKSGVQLNLSSKEYREYSSSFGIRVGYWKGLEDYSLMTIIPAKERTLIAALFAPWVGDSESYETVYYLYMYRADFGSRLMLESFYNIEDAINRGADLAKELKLSWIDYSSEIQVKYDNVRRGKSAI